MPLPPLCRVIIDPQPESGRWNMAVDEVLLDGAMERDECSLRWYRWNEPTVSLGYFQESESASATPQTAGLPAVRRLTGGGAILHHHEWTYSCAIPVSHPLATVPHQLYVGIHESIVAVLNELGVECRLRGANRPESEGLFLCFGRGDQRDIVCGEQKVVGSAQRRRRGAVLQHGSVLIARSRHAPEFPGVQDLNTEVVLPADLAERFAARIAPLLADRSETTSLSSRELASAEQLQQERYSKLDWQARVNSRK